VAYHVINEPNSFVYRFSLKNVLSNFKPVQERSKKWRLNHSSNPDKADEFE